MGTSLEKMSGPVTLGSVGFTGKALTSGAPGEGIKVELVFIPVKQFANTIKYSAALCITETVCVLK